MLFLKNGTLSTTSKPKQQKRLSRKQKTTKNHITKSLEAIAP